MNWISIEDKLPPIGKPVIVYCPPYIDRYGDGEDDWVEVLGAMYLAEYCYAGKYGFWWELDGTRTCRPISHWHELPEPPDESR